MMNGIGVSQADVGCGWWKACHHSQDSGVHFPNFDGRMHPDRITVELGPNCIDAQQKHANE
jgi:hypothetical protein